MPMMSHPKHGRTHAVGAEVAANRANGWTIDQPKAKAPVEAPVEPVAVAETVASPEAVAVVEQAPEPVAAPKPQERSRFGRR